MILSQLPDGARRVMVIVAHPDDAEFIAGGSLAAWVGQGTSAQYVVVTDGSKGSPERGVTAAKLAEVRRREQQAAARLIGVEQVVFLGRPDNELVADLELRRLLTREIRRGRPDVVITHDPTTFYYDDYINHPDHRAAGEAALYAIFPTSRDHLNFPELLAEGLEPHKVTHVLLGGSRQPDVWVDIGDTMEAKLAALREHKSQFADQDRMAQRVRERAAAAGHGPGLALAEAFKHIVLH
jgi:LmbE family N-acetylglucosaminyl deacetylase